MKSDFELRVIHALRLQGFADTDAVAAFLESDEAITKEFLESLAADGLVRYLDTHRSGWTLTMAGRARGETLLSDELAQAGNRSTLEAMYQDFLELNQPFLRLCTRWQTKVVDGKQIVNDHGDADYDAHVIAQLIHTDHVIRPICERLEGQFDRFRRYSRRFAFAAAMVQAGDLDYFTKATIDSYHTIWFQLHEDLLATLGIERAKEGQL